LIEISNDLILAPRCRWGPSTPTTVRHPLGLADARPNLQCFRGQWRSV